MSITQTTSRTTAIALGAVVAIFFVTVVAVTVVAVAVKDGAIATAIVGVIVGLLAPTIGTIVTLLKVLGVEGKVDQVAADTNALTNGLMDSKIRASVADVVHDDYLDPEAEGLVAADRERRDQQHAEQ